MNLLIAYFYFSKKAKDGIWCILYRVCVVEGFICMEITFRFYLLVFPYFPSIPFNAGKWPFLFFNCRSTGHKKEIILGKQLVLSLSFCAYFASEILSAIDIYLKQCASQYHYLKGCASQFSFACWSHVEIWLHFICHLHYKFSVITMFCSCCSPLLLNPLFVPFIWL